MAHQLLCAAKSAALAAFRKGEDKVRVHGIILHICHAHGNEHQVLLPDQTELFRIVGTAQNATIYVV
jgi:uncharacterized Rossmann fold enzyme